MFKKKKRKAAAAVALIFKWFDKKGTVEKFVAAVYVYAR